MNTDSAHLHVMPDPALFAGLQGPLRTAVIACLQQVPACADPGQLSETLQLLELLNVDPDVLAATILHDHSIRGEQAEAAIRHSPAIAGLLEGQIAAGQVWSLHAEHRGSVGHRGSEGLRRLLLAIVRDLRVVLILLARQLAAMRRASRLPPDEQQALARLTRDIHAPLANRLGIWQLKWELEDLAFRHLQPQMYQDIAALLDEKRIDREAYIARVCKALAQAMQDAEIHADVAGRSKHIYSIWRKMQRKQAPLGELYDLRAVRVLVDDVAACYAALGVVHAMWAPVPGEFDDYIARPKRNDYRSLHTAVIGPEGKTLEVQIRTTDMHRHAELGVAAHWRYKEGRSASGDAALDRKIGWMRQLLDNAEAAQNEQGELQGGFATELVEDRVYALTPRGEVIDLPQGSTPLDFAYHIHTEVGHRCRGAKVDGRIVTLQHALRSGDRVEILTGKVSEPRRDWIVASNGYLASPRSREKVRNWFHRLDRARNLQAGRELLDRELKRAGLQQADLAPVLIKFNATTIDDLHVQLALGDVGAHQVIRALGGPDRGRKPDAVRSASRKPHARNAVTVVGVDNLLTQLARCCQPLPGEDIVGYLTRHSGVSVHRADCHALRRACAQEPERVLPVEWGGASSAQVVEIVLDAHERKSLSKDIIDLLAQQSVPLVETSSTTRRGQTRVRLRVRADDIGMLSRILGKLRALPGVTAARRA